MFLGRTVLGTWNFGFRRMVSRSQVVDSGEAGPGTAQMGPLLKRVGGRMNGQSRVHLCHSEDQTGLAIGRGRWWTYYLSVILDRRDTVHMLNAVCGYKLIGGCCRLWFGLSSSLRVVMMRTTQISEAEGKAQRTLRTETDNSLVCSSVIPRFVGCNVLKEREGGLVDGDSETENGDKR